MDLFSNNKSGLLDNDGNFLPVDYDNSIDLTPNMQSVTLLLYDRQKSILEFLKGYYSGSLNSTDKKAMYLMNRLQSELNLTKELAAGVAGNIWVESKFNTKAIGDKGEAHGIALWHSDRRIGIDMLNTSYEDQVSHIIKELKGSEKRALYALKSTNTPRLAAAVFDLLFERSDGKHRKLRLDYADKYFKL